MVPIMADRNEKLLLEVLKKPGNNVCADCGSKSKMFEAFLGCRVTLSNEHRNKSRIYKTNGCQRENIKGMNI
jgi:hypothetical protein